MSFPYSVVFKTRLDLKIVEVQLGECQYVLELLQHLPGMRRSETIFEEGPNFGNHQRQQRVQTNTNRYNSQRLGLLRPLVVIYGCAVSRAVQDEMQAR